MKNPIIIEPPQQAEYAVIWLHGLGADGSDFAGVVPMLAFAQKHQTRFILPHAPVRPITINMGYSMPGWYDIYSLGDFKREDLDGMAESAAMIEALIAEQINAGIPPQRIILGGFSQGGAMSLFTGLRYQQALAGIFCLSAYLPAKDQVTTLVDEVNHKTPILMCHGVEDSVVPILAGEQSHEALMRAGFDVEWHHFHMDHSVCPEEITVIADWIEACYAK